MEMAKYIMQILRSQLMVMWSWGFNSPIAVKNGLRFKVQGFKFRGIVEVVYNEGSDLFDVSFIKAGKVVKAIDGVFFDMLVMLLTTMLKRPQTMRRELKRNTIFKFINTDYVCQMFVPLM